jgi:PAS domain S-box-containing protein
MNGEDNKTILLVEDEAIIAIAQKMTLEKRGYTVLTANSGDKAVEIFKQNKGINLVLMDIDLGGGLDGTETADIILNQRAVPLVFLSSHTEPEIVGKTEKITSYSYVVKNSGITVLDASIKMAYKLFEAHESIQLQKMEIVAAYEEMEATNEELEAVNEELIKTEKEIMESETRFKALHNASFGGITIHDQGVIIECNQGLSEITGYSYEELIGMNGLLLISEKTRDMVMGNIKAGYEKPYEAIGLRKNGEEFPIRLEARNIPYKGKMVRTVEFRDITETRKMKDALLAERDRAEKFLDVAGVMLIAMDRNGMITLINRKGCQILGVEREDVLGKNWFDQFIHNSISEEIRNVFTMIMRGEIESVEFYENAVITGSGEERIIAWHNSILYDAAENINGVLCSGEDITDRKRAEEELRQYEWITEKTSPPVENTSDEFKPDYGDVLQYNRQRTILDGVGRDNLADMAEDIMALLDSSFAVYESNGDYAYGVFKSGWCRVMDNAGFRLCGTDDAEKALRCGKWLCHENCWNDSAKAAIEAGKPTDIECAGGINLYAVPVRANNQIIGVVNIGYGNPPKDDNKLLELSEKYKVDYELLRAKAYAYKARPDFIIELGRRRCRFMADLIGKTIERRQDAEKIESLLSEKDLLLKETHHRVKNNMVTIFGLLTLQSDAHDNPEVKEVLRDAAIRVQSMAILYEKLYHSENTSEASVKEYFTTLISEIISTFNPKGPVKMDLVMDDIVLNAQLLSPLGIIINEFITNSMKYAFTDSSSGIITLKVSLKGTRVIMTYEDNGAGLPDSVTFKESNGFGMQLISMLTEQIGGSIKIERGKGARFVLEFDV